MALLYEYLDVNTQARYAVTLPWIYYKFGNGVQLKEMASAAWCIDCNQVMPAEHIDSLETIDQTRLKLLSLISGLSEYAEEYDWLELIMSPTQYLKECETRWRLFASRRSGERCLHCSGTNIRHINVGVGKTVEIEDGPTLLWKDYAFADIGPEVNIYLDSEGRLMTVKV